MKRESERDMLTVAEAAQELGITVRGVQERLLRGAMRGERLTPRMWVIPREEVERWRGKGRLKPGRPPKEPTADELHRGIAEHQDALEEGRRRIRGEAPEHTDEIDQPDELHEARRQVRGEI